MPFSELGELSGVPNQPQAGPASLPSAPQLKAKSALGAFAAQRVAGLAQPALHLVENALAAGRRGVMLPCSLCCNTVQLMDAIANISTGLQCCTLCSWVLHHHIHNACFRATACIVKCVATAKLSMSCGHLKKKRNLQAWASLTLYCTIALKWKRCTNTLGNACLGSTHALPCCTIHTWVIQNCMSLVTVVCIRAMHCPVTEMVIVLE